MEPALMKERKKNGGSDGVAAAQNLAAVGLHRGVARRSWQARTGAWGSEQGREKWEKEERKRREIGWATVVGWLGVMVGVIWVEKTKKRDKGWLEKKRWRERK
ncbi:uncharacterized protein DS421_18g625660 [Arachis hypogaea]|nr:uncharacterized protein DS421_18g625660 [Arachis hypogaea]